MKTLCEGCGHDPCKCPPAAIAREALNDAISRFRTLELQWRNGGDEGERQHVLAFAIFADQVKQAANALGNILGQSGAKR